MCGKSFQKVDHIDCKIVAYKMKKELFFSPCKRRVSRLWIPLINFFSLLKVVVFDIVVAKWVENPWKKENLKKYLFSIIKRYLSRQRYVMKRNTKLLIIQILKNVKTDLKNKHYMLFFPRDVIIAYKTKFVIFFISLMNIKKIITFIVDMDVFNVIKNLKFYFWCFLEAVQIA